MEEAKPHITPQQAERMLLGEETFADKVQTAAGSSPEIENLSRDVPRAEWKNHLGRELAIPGEYLALLINSESLGKDGVAKIEEATERAHGVTEPFGIMLELVRGRTPHAILIHEEEGWF